MRKQQREDVALVREALGRLGLGPFQRAAVEAFDRLAKEARRGEKMTAIVKSMFDGRQLDPYPTSDTSPEYLLRKLTKWKRKAKKD